MAILNNPTLQQRMMQLEQEYAQQKANLMQNYLSQQNGAWGNMTPSVTTPAPAPSQNVAWITVNGLQGAKEHQVPANATHWLMDSNESVFYVKSADEFGVSKQMKAFRFAEMDLSSNDAPAEQIDTSMYVRRDEFDELKAKIEQMAKKPIKTAKEVKEGSDNG